MWGGDNPRPNPLAVRAIVPLLRGSILPRERGASSVRVHRRAKRLDVIALLDVAAEKLHRLALVVAVVGDGFNEAINNRGNDNRAVDRIAINRYIMNICLSHLLSPFTREGRLPFWANTTTIWRFAQLGCRAGGVATTRFLKAAQALGD